MNQSFYPEDDMLCFSAIINAYIYGLISYLDYKHYTKTYIAYHEITDEQFIEAYAKADAFFLEPTQIEHKFRRVLAHKSYENDEKWLQLYQRFKNDCPHSDIVGAMEQQ